MPVHSVPVLDRAAHTAGPTRGGLAFDVLLAAACLAVTLVVNVGGSETVAANRETDALTVSLTVVAVGSTALRRRYPLPVLVVSLAAVLGLIVSKGTVGMAPIGPFLATWTAVALAAPRDARRAVGAVVAALVLTWVLDPVDLSPHGAVLNVAVFAAVIVWATGSRARRERVDADLLAAEHRVALERERAATTATQERLRITRELHDALGHSMSVMVIQAAAAGRMLDTHDPERAREAVSEIERTGRRSMTEMRQLLGVLRAGDPHVVDSSRAPAPTLDDVEGLVRRVVEAGLPTTLSVHGPRGAVAAGVDLAAYRIVQEALTNCLKHAGATTASVSVTYAPAEVTISVVDDGQGPGPETPRASPGHGVVGMRERVAMYGGTLRVGAGPDGGFRVDATLPLGTAP